MKRDLVLCLILVLMLVFSGCASVGTTKSFNGMALASGKQNVCHVHGKITGLYCFTIPLITGDPNYPGSFIPLFFQDTASLDSVAAMISDEARIVNSE